MEFIISQYRFKVKVPAYAALDQLCIGREYCINIMHGHNPPMLSNWTISSLSNYHRILLKGKQVLLLASLQFFLTFWPTEAEPKTH